jgi:hypothetical protein
MACRDDNPSNLLKNGGVKQMEESKFIQDEGTKEQIAVWELFHNNPKLKSISGRKIKTGELKGKIKIDISYED